MEKLIIGIILGLTISSIASIIVCSIFENQKYKRNCKNCKHSTPYEGKDGYLHFYCGLPMQKDISTFPVKEDNYCGHFDYTDELKTEQVKENAEKLIRNKSNGTK